MLESLWIRLAIASVLAGAVALGGYKIGAWRTAAAGASAEKESADKLAACKSDLATQRETDLTGANHALADQLQEASDQATKDAKTLADLATKMQSDALHFGANTRALYETVAGACTLTPDFVRLLRQAADQANSANRYHSGVKADPPKAGSGDGGTTPVSNPSGRPRPTAEGKAGDHTRPPVQ